MGKGRSVPWRVGDLKDRDPEEARKLKVHSGHRVNIKNVYKTTLYGTDLDAVSLECQDCCEVLLWYQKGYDFDIPDVVTKHAYCY